MWKLDSIQVTSVCGFFSSHFLIEIKYQSWIKLTAGGVIEGKDQTKTRTSYLSLSVPPFLHFYHISNYHHSLSEAIKLKYCVTLTYGDKKGEL